MWKAQRAEQQKQKTGCVLNSSQEKATDGSRSPCSCDQKYCSARANREMLKSAKIVPVLSCPVKEEDLNPTDSAISEILVYMEKERASSGPDSEFVSRQQCHGFVFLCQISKAKL